MRHRKVALLLIQLCTVTVFLWPVSAKAALDKKVLNLINKVVFEVVVKKPPEQSITYERPLPLDLLPYVERMDKYHSVGTAFAISPTELVSAAHVLSLDQESQFTDYFVRDGEGKVYPIENIVAYSERRDFVSFSVKDRRFDSFLPVNPAPEINEKVYAVGNALGEGIVIRDGLYTSNTPEELNGEWKWLRFSAAASPGNSGGPLLDDTGAVIGIVVRKSPNENLNIALPIREVTADQSGRASVFKKHAYTLQNMQQRLVDTFSWETPLPKPYKALNGEITAALNTYTERLLARFLAENKDRIFPHGSESQSLLNRHYHENFPRLISHGVDGKWDAMAPGQTGTLQLGNNGFITLGAIQKTLLMQFRKPDDIPLATFYSDSKVFMDTFLKAVGASREVGIDKVKVTSLGKADSESEHIDKYGRKWLIRTWSCAYDNSRTVSASLPVPGGMVTLMRGGQTAAAFDNLLDLKALTDFVYVSYCGSLKSWREFLTMKQYLPPLFTTMKIDFEYGKEFQYQSNRLAFALDTSAQKITETSDLHLSLGYFKEGQGTVWDVKEISVGEDQESATNFKLTRYSKPPSEIDDSEKADWEKMVARKPPFDHASYIEENSTKISTVGAPGDKDQPQPAVLYRIGYRKEGTHAQQEMATALDGFVKRVTILETEKEAVGSLPSAISKAAARPEKSL